MSTFKQQGGSDEWSMWHVACGMWHVACGMWHVACGMWHVACGMYGKEEKNTQVLMGKTEGKRTTGRSRHR